MTRDGADHYSQIWMEGEMDFFSIIYIISKHIPKSKNLKTIYKNNWISRRLFCERPRKEREGGGKGGKTENFYFYWKRKFPLFHLSSLFCKYLFILGESLVAQTVKNPPAVKETWVRFLSQEDPLEKGMATHSSIFAWKIPWTEEPVWLQCLGSQRDTPEPLTPTLWDLSTIFSHSFFLTSYYASQFWLFFFSSLSRIRELNKPQYELNREACDDFKLCERYAMVYGYNAAYDRYFRQRRGAKWDWTKVSFQSLVPGFVFPCSSITELYRNIRIA